jgi:isoleucyl-tRNA synthetase
VSAVPNPSFPKLDRYQSLDLESLVRRHWEEKRVPQLLQEKRQWEGARGFFLLDGPPYVNALPHVGHVKTTTCKDVWSKFKLMQGFDAYLQPGFDCHGLPVEVMVQKELNITAKSDIDRMGIAKFDELCLQKVTNNERGWLEVYRRLGAWRGYFEPYFTYRRAYIESAWWTLKTLHEKGFLARRPYPTHWCPTCETVLSGYEVSDSYKDVSDPSVYVKFKLKGAANEYLVVWTTTPWTLPSNVAVFAHPSAAYVKVKVKRDGKDEVYILAKARADAVLKELAGLSYDVLSEFPGSELDGAEYEPLLDVEAQRALRGTKAHRVYLSIPLLKVKRYKKHKFSEEAGAKAGAAAKPSVQRVEKRDVTLPAGEGDEFEDFVTLEDGSGLVHAAPGHGATDFKVGEHYGLPRPSPVDERGRLTAEVSRWQGKFVKDADKEIVQALEEEGKLLHFSKITHKYPLCWRCKTPLVYRLSEQWYLSIEPVKERMLEANESVKWMPASGREFFQNWLEQSTDWCISRQRYWSIPIPVWSCASCKAFEVVGGLAELRKRARKDPGDLPDLHRHSVDAIELACKVCGGTAKRVPDVFDVWYDSGIAPWASLGYPHQNKELFERLFPVSLINESQDQIRGWFYYLMFASMATFGKPAYERVAMMGWVLDAKGEKMSKSLGNVVEGKAALEKMGADALRLYYCSETAAWDVQKFNFAVAEEVRRNLNILWNSWLFWDTYKPEGYQPRPLDAKRAKSLKPLDRWLLSRSNSLAAEVTKLLEEFEFHRAGRALVEFVTADVSRWYIRLSRDRLSPANSDREDHQACADVLRHALLQAMKLLAPITPFLSDYLYAQLDGSKDSVLAETYPKVDYAFVDEALEKHMSLARAAVEAVNAARQEAKLKLRWPVREVGLAGPSPLPRAVQELEGILREACNARSVKYLEHVPAGWLAKPFAAGSSIYLDPTRDEELLGEAFLRELARAVQAARKEAGLSVRDRIHLVVHSEDAGVRSLLSKHAAELAHAVGAREARVAAGESELGAKPLSVELGGLKAKVSFAKA